ncbi:MAG TPA: FecR family protein [Usitatibacter sp.]|nr:FecR family protein [Usitatibacter sp.]
MQTKLFAVLAATLLQGPAAFAQPVIVDAVQYPAWLERGGRAVPLTPGTPLEPRDRLRTGANARVQLKLPEGSAVKLGENAQFVIERAEDRGVFRAALSVIAGAFRYTTGIYGAGGRRDVAIKVKNVTVGIRGTDLWGKSTADRDWVVLLEGKISVGSEGSPTVELEQPLDWYQKPRGAAPEIARADRKLVEEWARETEISGEGAGARTGGRWRTVAAAKPSRDDAMALSRSLRAAGFPSEVVAKEGYFIVQVPGLAGEGEARALMSSIRGIAGVAQPTVHEGP